MSWFVRSPMFSYIWFTSSLLMTSWLVGIVASLRAISSTTAGSSSAGTAFEANPSRSASTPLSASPVSISLFACSSPRR